jgi:hypothetical protein
MQCVNGCVRSYSVHYVSWGVYIPKVDALCYGVCFLVVLYVCPGCWFSCVAFNFGLMKTVNYAVDYVSIMALTMRVQLITFEV